MLFAPIVFQVVRTMRDLNILDVLSKSKTGLTYDELSKECEISKYGIQVLCETALSAGVVFIKERKSNSFKIGFLLIAIK